MYQKLFLKDHHSSSTATNNNKTASKSSTTAAGANPSDKDKKNGSKDDSQPYASFDCPECVQMASLMLEEELRFYM